MNSKEKTIRPATVAGTFYPADKSELKAMLDDYLNAGIPKKVDGDIIGIVAPHAGYVFSGHVAGSAFRELKGRKYDVVIIISPTHVKAFRGASVFSGDAYTTPLGTIDVDKEMAELIADFTPSIEYSLNGHEWGKGQTEHSLEVELPFIQEVLPDAPIVPIVIGSQNFETTDKLMRAIVHAVKLSGKKPLLVASSDLSHFHDVSTANTMDSMIVDAFNNYQYFKLSNQLFAGRWEACGGAPIVTVMMTAEQLGANMAVSTKYATSADVPAGSGSRNRCVGYFAGVVVKGNKEPEYLPDISDEDKNFLLEAARHGVKNAVYNTVSVSEPGYENSSLLKNYATFVTLHKEGKLRGCMGHLFTDDPLPDEVRETSRLASLNDYRFGPVGKDEIDKLEYEVTILSRMIRCLDTSKIEVGRDGLYIRLGNRTGLLLPQVATERDWDRKTFLEHTCIKAGLPVDAYRDDDAMLYTFRALVIN